MPKTYKFKICPECRKIFTPTGNHSMRCQDCSEIRREVLNRKYSKEYYITHKDTVLQKRKHNAEIKKKQQKEIKLWGKKLNNITEKQIEFVFTLRGYRRRNNKSQEETARIFSAFGK